MRVRGLDSENTQIIFGTAKKRCFILIKPQESPLLWWKIASALLFKVADDVAFVEFFGELTTVVGDVSSKDV